MYMYESRGARQVHNNTNQDNCMYRMYVYMYVCIKLFRCCMCSLHDAAEVNDIAISQFQLEIKRSTYPSTTRHPRKVDRHDRVKLYVDCRFVDEDEAVVERIEVAGGGSV